MALKIKTREEAIAVLRDMVNRKREREAQAQLYFAKAREEAAERAAFLTTTKRNASTMFAKYL